MSCSLKPRNGGPNKHGGKFPKRYEDIGVNCIVWIHSYEFGWLNTAPKEIFPFWDFKGKNFLNLTNSW